MSPDRIPAGHARPSPQQLRLCVTQEISPDSPALNHGLLLRPDPSVDMAIFRDAIEAVATGHDVLRGRFQRGGPDGWIVRPGLPARHEFNVVRLGEEDLIERAQQEVDRPFDLTREPPLRVHWWRVGPATSCQLTFHHIATDARTIDLLLDEVQRHYSGCEAPAEAQEYYSIAAQAWSRREGAGYLKRLREYTERVAESGMKAPFPAASGRAPETLAVAWQVPSDVAKAVHAHAKALSCTRFAVWLTAWTRAIAGIFDRQIVPVAVPVSSRLSSAELAAVGFFVNSVVIPLRHDRNEPFATACRRTFSKITEALDCRDIPLNELVHQLSLPERGIDNPLTAVSAQLLPAERRLVNLPDGSVGITYLESRSPRYRLALEIRDHSEVPTARIRAEKNLIEPARLQVLRHLMELDITEVKRSRIGNQTTRASGKSSSNHDLVAPVRQWIRGRPNKLAVQWAGGRWTWQQLGDAIDNSMSMLKDHGIRAGDTVTIELQRGPYFVATLIALLEIDAIPVMARSGWPEATRAQIAAQVGAPLRVTNPQHVFETPIARTELTRLRQTSVPAGTAYVTFTSGSTGQPKGVPTPAQGARNYLDWIGTAAGINQQDRCLQVAAVGFDALVRDTLTPLKLGAALILLPDELRLNGKGTAQFISTERISVILSLIPAQLRLITSYLEPPAPRIICVAGEPLFRIDAENLRKSAPNCELLNLYGPTEATMTSTFFAVNTNAESDRIPVGQPIPNAAVHVLSPDGSEVLPGCSGEIVISGPGVAKSYINGSKVAAARFGFRLLGGRHRWSYATGDIGYLLEDGGGLRIEGRVDSEHKVNGERVDLAAVESVLSTHPAVEDSAVSVERHNNLDIVCAHVLLRDNSVSDDQLRLFLAGKISNVAMPRRFSLVNYIPRLANGKLDRARLPSLQGASPEAHPNGQLPSWPQVQRAVAEVLGQFPRDTQATLFDLGADSLAVIEILERLDVLQVAPERAIRVFNDSRLATLVGLLDGSRRLAAVAGDQRLGSLIPVAGADLDSGKPTIICFPPAGGDLVSFSPAADFLKRSANLVVARRPDASQRSVATAAWVDAHILQIARNASLLPAPVLLCGYSIGFLLACLASDALATNFGYDVHSIIGINPSTWESVDAISEQPGMSTDSGAKDRFTADLAIRLARRSATESLPRLFLLQGDSDWRSWDQHAGRSAQVFSEVVRAKIPGQHILTIEEMREVGGMISEWIAEPERSRDL